MAKRDTQSKTIVNRHLDILVCLILIAATFVGFWQVTSFDFVNYDDDKYVTDNHNIRSGLTVRGIIWAFTSTHANFWHPLTMLSHMLDCQLFGMKAGMHHLSNLLLHLANTVLLFLIFRRMTGALWRSGFVAALFALHPLHVESVVWISERKDLLSTLFWFLTMWSYIWYVDKPTVNRYLLAFLLFILGMMAKPMLVTLPFVLLLLDYWPLGRFHVGESGDVSDGSEQKAIALRLIREKIPFFVIAAAASILAYVAQREGGALPPFDKYPFGIRIANTLISYVGYIGKMIWPDNLAVYYPYRDWISIWQTALASLLLICISVMVVRAMRKHPYLMVGWLWYLGTLVPVSGLVQVGSHSMADRYTYVPFIGLFVMFLWGAFDLATRWRHGIIAVALATGAILSACLTVTFHQVSHWKNSIMLFEHVLEVTSNNYIAYNNLGNALQEEGRLDEAIRHYVDALHIRPDYEDAHNNLGLALQKKGRMAEAIKHYVEALRIRPDYKEVHNNLGLALQEEGRIPEAIMHYVKALRIQPDYEVAHYNLGNALQEEGRTAEAIKHYVEALRIRPDYGQAHNNLAVALFHQGNIEGAANHFRAALRINPDSINIRDNLEKVLMIQKKISD